MHVEKVEEIKKERDSNFELCRLVCMLYIVIYHLIIHVPSVYENTSWGLPLRNICHIGVVVFVMISGYFGIHRKWKRLLSLALSVSFYNALGILIAVWCFNQQIELNSMLSVIFPITNGEYWFITSYVVLYLIAPYINMVLEKLNKRDFTLLLIVLGIIVWYGGGVWNKDIGEGRGIMAFILSYSIGSYIRKFYNTETKKLSYWGGHYLLASFIMITCITFLPGILSKAITHFTFGYNQLGLYIMSVLFLLIFQSVKIRSRIINWSATSCLGIYLCHGNTNISSLIIYPLYSNNLLGNIDNQWLLLLAHIVFAFGVVTCCVLIDKVRQFMFIFIERR